MELLSYREKVRAEEAAGGMFSEEAAGGMFSRGYRSSRSIMCGDEEGGSQELSYTFHTLVPVSSYSFIPFIPLMMGLIGP
jgi:hypothetical protein